MNLKIEMKDPAAAINNFDKEQEKKLKMVTVTQFDQQRPVCMEIRLAAENKKKTNEKD